MFGALCVSKVTKFYNIGRKMNRKSISGLIGIAVGGFLLFKNYQYFDEQGFVAIGMPLIILICGVIYLYKGLKK